MSKEQIDFIMNLITIEYNSHFDYSTCKADHDEAAKLANDRCNELEKLFNVEIDDRSFICQ